MASPFSAILSSFLVFMNENKTAVIPKSTGRFKNEKNKKVLSKFKIRLHFLTYMLDDTWACKGGYLDSYLKPGSVLFTSFY